GRVEDEAGAAVEAARVTLRRKLRESGAVEQPDGDPRGDRRQSAVVASDGRFVFASLEPGRFTVEAQAVGFHAPEQAEVDLEPGATFTVPAIVLQRQSIIRGTVHRADGTAAEGLEVSVASRGHVDVVDYKGHFELPGLAPGAYTLSVGKWTLGHPFLQADVTLADSETRALDLVIPRLPVVRGRVTAGGVGLAGCNVQAMQQKSDPPSRQYAVNASCDDDGAFVLQLEQEGQFLVTASTSTGGCSAPVPVTAAWGLDLPLDFELGAASIAGHVVDAADGTSPPGMEVQLLREGEPATDWVATDEAGRFFIHPLAAGSYVLQSRSEACPLTPLASELRLLDGQALQGVVVPVSKGAVIDGTVLDVHGQPDGSWVYFVSLADPNKATRCGAADGRFHFEGLAPGAGRLVVAGAGYADELLDEHAAASIKAMEEASLDIVLEPGEHRQVTLQKVR
ncbi:MAG TPA: carboxypeptidase-like regulatory domain-containing protein, partial [Planctomycetota bacterium]|nr:carboxypeptidase-like regulatory domain-containing protein [Planctomycetota bacterium]